MFNINAASINWMLLSATISCASNITASSLELPDIAGSAEGIFTPVEERRLGRAFMRNVRQQLPIIDDVLVSDYINSLGQRLASKIVTNQREFYFFTIDRNEINAFAGPGGNIGVFSGLILASDSESELSAVLAHEIAHVTQNHLHRAFEDARNMSIPTAALLLAAIVLGATAGGDVGMAAAASVQATALQHQIDFTREHEKEADAVGIQILTAADFDPHGMPGFFERISKASRLYENNAPEFLRTHPVTTNRIADAMGRADTYPYRQRLDDLNYSLIRAALRERGFTDPKQAVKHFKDTLMSKRYRAENAERYGYALALLRAGKITLARQEANLLLAKTPTNIPFILLQARVDAESGHATRAMQFIASALELFPSNAPLASYYAQLCLTQNQPSKAIAYLDQALSRNHKEQSLYELRARLANAVGDTAEAHLFLAEANVLNGELEVAVQRLGAALRTERFNEYGELKLRSRLAELEQELKADEIGKEFAKKR
jgi:predicted Zn-dependent protease